MRPVSCLKCAFLTGSFVDGRKTYRCKFKKSRIVDVKKQIMCSRFQRKQNKVAKKETESKDDEVNLESYFDTEPLLRSMIDRRQGR